MCIEDTACPFCDAVTDAGQLDASVDASSRVGDEETVTAVPVYGAPGCDFATDAASASGVSSPMFGGAVIAVAAVAVLRRRKSPS